VRTYSTTGSRESKTGSVRGDVECDRTFGRREPVICDQFENIAFRSREPGHRFFQSRSLAGCVNRRGDLVILGIREVWEGVGRLDLDASVARVLPSLLGEKPAGYSKKPGESRIRLRDVPVGRLEGDEEALANQISDIFGIGAASDGISGYRVGMTTKED
jgi:hypothetical protein